MSAASAGSTSLLSHQGGSYPDTRNQYSMTIQLLDAPPQNDACANARVISSVPYTDTEDNSNAAADGQPGRGQLFVSGEQPDAAQRGRHACSQGPGAVGRLEQVVQPGSSRLLVA